MKRYSENPILTREDVPDLPPRLVDASSVFNPGAVKDGDVYRLMLRVQARSRETFLLMASSADGIHFEVEPRIVRFEGIDDVSETLYHVYDPRITRIDDTFFVMFAADTGAGCRLGVARTTDFEHFDLVGIGAGEDTRNGVLFPEKIGGHYLRLERPNRVALRGGPTSGDEIVLSESTDLICWQTKASVMQGRPHYWDEHIGSGPPPVKTREGWLHVYHGVATHFQSASVYQAGVVLLDLHDPSRVLARSRSNILEPRAAYEFTGQVPNVVFPSGMITEEHDSEGYACPEGAVFLYYGAADTCVGLATATVAELLATCHEG